MANNFLFSSYIYPMEKDLTLAQAIEHVKNFHHAFLLPVRQEPAAHIPKKR